MKIRLSVIQLLMYLFLLIPGAVQSDQFSIVVIPDTQIYVEDNPEIFEAQVDWIIANQVAENIIYVSHLGDLKDDRSCDNKIVTAGTGGGRTEWEIVDDTLQDLDNANIPYGLVPGNHDFDQVSSTCPNYSTERPLVTYNSLLGPLRFSGRPYYGDPGAGTPGNRVAGSNEDNFTLFESNGYKFIAINLAYKQAANAVGNDAEVVWADGLLKTYSDRLGIITTHYFLDQNPEVGAFGSRNNFAPYGQEVYDGLSDNPNLFMMLSAHQRGEAWRVEDRSADGMQPVQALLSDYQSVNYPADPNNVDYANLDGIRNNNGDGGFMRIMRFDTDTGMVSIETFSPPVVPILNRTATLVSNYFPASGAGMDKDTASNLAFSFQDYVPPPPAPTSPWSGTGPGTILVQDGSTSDPSLDYSLTGTSVFSTQTWLLGKTADVTESITVPYSYTGFHAFFQVRVFVDAFISRDGVTTFFPVLNEGPANCCTTPSAGFTYAGSVPLDVQAGDTYGFRFGGSNFDSDSRLLGVFTIPGG